MTVYENFKGAVEQVSDQLGFSAAVAPAKRQYTRRKLRHLEVGIKVKGRAGVAKAKE